MIYSQKLLKRFASDITQKNKTINAIESFLKDVEPESSLEKVSEIPFSSERKFSACIYKKESLILGAPEILLNKGSKLFSQIQSYTNQAYRVVIFGILDQALNTAADFNPDQLTPLLMIILEDPIREEAYSTLKTLNDNNIEYRIISGDSTETVSAIAKNINQNFLVKAISGSEIDQLSPDKLEQTILNRNVFSRIRPQQKQLIIKILKKHHLFTVMIGDGVNDVLALKESDLGIAMNNGSSMAKNVADVVLLNSSFATLPVILAEGRKILTNIQTIANIYLIKNISSIAAILMLGFIGLRFPFDPKHVEIASFLVIGVPSFVLAFDNHNFGLSDEGFLKRLILFSSVVGFTNSVVYTLLYTYYELASDKIFYSRSILLTAVVFLGILNIILIYLQHYSISQIFQKRLVSLMLSGILLAFLLSITLIPIRQFFDISLIEPEDLLISLGLCLTGAMINYKILTSWNIIKNTLATT